MHPQAPELVSGSCRPGRSLVRVIEGRMSILIPISIELHSRELVRAAGQSKCRRL